MRFVFSWTCRAKSNLVSVCLDFYFRRPRVRKLKSTVLAQLDVLHCVGGAQPECNYQCLAINQQWSLKPEIVLHTYVFLNTISLLCHFNGRHSGCVEENCLQKHQRINQYSPASDIQGWVRVWQCQIINVWYLRTWTFGSLWIYQARRCFWLLENISPNSLCSLIPKMWKKNSRRTSTMEVKDTNIFVVATGLFVKESIHFMLRESKGQATGQSVNDADKDEEAVGLTVTLCCPVRLGHSHSSWLSDRVRTQGVSPISTV